MNKYISLFAVLPAFMVSAANDWSGVYQFYESVDHQSWAYELHIKPDNSCIYTVDGFQTMTRLNCTVINTAAGVQIVTQKLAEECLFCSFKAGDTLFYLNTENGMVTTDWQLESPRLKHDDRTVYFVRE